MFRIGGYKGVLNGVKGLGLRVRSGRAGSFRCTCITTARGIHNIGTLNPKP